MHVALIGIPLWSWPLIALGGFLALLFTVALFEKNLTVPYKALDSSANPHMGPYVEVMSQALSAAGFEYGGPVTNPKHPVHGTVWRSQDRTTIAYTGSGTVLGIATARTVLFTPLEDSRFLVTTDQTDEGDPAGIFKYRRMINVEFEKLWNAHVKRMAAKPGDIRSFPHATPYEALMDIYGRRVNTLVERGRARFLDEQREQWVYTARGAASICLDFFVQLAVALPQFWRVNTKRIAPATGRKGFEVIPVKKD